MSEKRRGLGRGLGALIPTGLDTPRSTKDRPVDVFFPDAVGAAAEQAAAAAAEAAAVTSAAASDATVSVATKVPVESGDAASTAPTDGSASASQPGTSEPATSEPGTSESGTSAPTTSAPATSSVDLDRMPEPAEIDGLLPVPGARFAELPVGSIRPNPRQPRTVFDEDALSELVGSIREVGVLQPIVVRAVDDGYELIMGERRWRATQEAGLDTVPAIIRDTEDSDLLRDALLENLHRSQLNPLEEAAAYQQLLDDFGCTHEELASRIHRSRPQISNTLRLLRLPPLVQRRVAAGVLSAGHARALLGLGDGAAIERLAQRIVSEGLSVRAVEEIVSLGGDETQPKRRQRTRAGIRNEALDELASRLSDRFETRVKVDLGKTRGKLTVEFASVQDLNRILGALAPEDPGVLKH
ncbi:MAG: ParB/RepB/Spo0J family partition protein [Cellulomonas sp.]|uniref:ParB/RepB/Spo0J family partition protein n=1 Tax=Cellulomonas sp. TaxID=40001 RepID=UPI0019DBE5C9|nr:ParB/RepB/Spo0J family partition protein [Cellulomonas sp.]MBF0688096.1 ParB/RepB/Spo0J family partition protein [Cellulomonas sp.]